MVVIPSVEVYFLAAKQKSEFVQRFIEEMIDILAFPQQISQDIKDRKYEYYHIENRDVYFHYYVLAGQRVLQAKQKEIDSKNKDPNVRNFAIDSYGLFLINCFYGPQKANSYFSNGANRKFPYLAKYDIK